MDIGRAFSFVFEDAEWVKKILIGGLITLIPIIGAFVTYGYFLEILRRVYARTGDELPEWDDFGGYLVRGFLLWVGVVIWFLPILLLIGCSSTLVILAGSSGDDAVAVSFGLVGVGLIGLMFLVMMLWVVIFLPVVAGRYAIQQRFGAMFDFGEILTEIRRAGATPILLLLVTYLAVSFIAQFGIILCLIGVIFTSFYANLVVAHGAGQVYRRARGLDEYPATRQPPAF